MTRSLWILVLTLIAAPALAQDYSALQNRIDRVERDLTFLQRQVYQGGGIDPNGSAPAPTAGSGALQTQLMQLQEEMRALRGQVEEANFKTQRQAAEAQKFQQDVEFRLQALERAAVPAAAVAPDVPVTEPMATPATPATPATAPVTAPAPKPEQGFDVNASAPAATPAQYEPDMEPKTATITPREQYNRAFKQLNDAKYADAAASFSKFTKDHPKDALVPNAYYWMGESFYARRDFSAAADGFRQGYEANPKGQKAPDNLLKLSLSLANMKRLDEACIVLKQVSAQYEKTNKPIATKANNEYKRLGCA